MHPPRRWDLFCRVIDNFGDVGVAWRLAADLAGRGHAVRLWLDDASALAWMAPSGASGVALRPFADTGEAAGDVVVELFGCDPPEAFVERMAEGPRSPVWLNLEYLSAEDWVERSHGLPSPVSQGPGRGLVKWFYFPGFTPRTGGLIREPGLIEAVEAETRPAGPPMASVFCYDNPALPRLAKSYRGQLQLAQGPAQARADLPGARLPWLTQHGYDRLLWRSDLNFVRGEDSLVRAIWAGRPFVWQPYAQADGVHRRKLDALLARLLDGADAGLGGDVRRLWHAWNGFGPWPDRWPDPDPWHATCRRWRAALCRQPDLVSQMLTFVADRQ
ncbi:MAG: elongation factor P maturation arginine rhamnosyltransferase EarP [Rubrivivax sp.]|nr:elongation factor P maturation arginine rhamnosyltransferase EarP [Rubrivivax sp.]MDH5339144.1 elongation factor P maturation arginine rhamnosyltransferase EarP [Rubrivivax sp.]